MEAIVKEFRFPSHEKTYIRDFTSELNDAITESGTQNGRMLVESMHTTLGLLVTETAELKLLEDYIEWSLREVPEDERSTWKLDPGFMERYRDIMDFRRYRHRCADSPLLRPEEKDDDFNAARHIRSLRTNASIDRSYRDGRLSLGRFQGVALWEFDGRDGSGGNPPRDRRIVATMYPASKVTILPSGRFK